MKSILTIVGTGLAALAASACCWIPALLGAGAAGSLGIGAVLTPYRPYLLGLTAVFLIAGFAMVYRKPGGDCCSADGCLTDSAKRKRRTNIGVMWSVGLLSIVMAAYPYLGQAQLDNANAATRSVPGTAAAHQLVFNVEGMDCAACAVPIKERVEALPGVSSATIDFDAKTLVVRANPDTPGTGAIIRAVADAGFTAERSSKTP